MGALSDLWSSLIGRGPEVQLIAPTPPPDLPPLVQERATSPIVTGASLAAGITIPSIYGNGTVLDGYREGYSVNPWVYACALKVAQAVASVPWRVGKKTGRTFELLEQVSPLEHLLNNPNPAMSRSTFTEKITLDLLLGGNGIIWEQRAGKNVAQLWPVNPDYVTPIADKSTFISGYQIQSPSAYVVSSGTYPASDIIHAQFVSPVDPYWGMAPYLVASGVAGNSSKAIEWNSLAYNNRIAPDAIVSIPEHITWEQYVDMKKVFNDSLQTSANSHQPAFISGGAKLTLSARTPVEMDFIKSFQMSREDICAVFQVPPPVAGDLTRGTYSNIETAVKIFWNVAVRGILERLAGVYNLSLAPSFGTGLIAVPDYESIPELRTISKETAEIARIFHERGVPFANINRRLGLGFSSFLGDDIGFMQSSVVTVEQVLAGETGATGASNMTVNMISATGEVEKSPGLPLMIDDGST